MKWFRHLSDSRNGRMLRATFREFGLEGEARYWRVIEMCAQRWDPAEGPPELSFSKEYVRESIRHRSWTNSVPFLDHLATIGLLIWEDCGNNVLIKIPMLAEIKDNTHRRLVVATKTIGSSYQLDKIRVDKSNNTPIVPNGDVSQKVSSSETKPEPAGDGWHTIVDLWGQICHNFPQPKKIDDRRKRKLQAAWRANPGRDFWEAATKALAGSAFHAGENDRGWKADMEFLLRPGKALAIVEGGVGARPRRKSIEEILGENKK